MTIDKATMQQIIDRATEDPDFVVGLARDPYSTLEAAGISVSAEDAKAVESALQASGESLAEPLQARISPASLASLFAGLAQQMGSLVSQTIAPAVLHEGQPVAPGWVHEGQPVAPDVIHMGQHPAPDVIHE